MIKKQVFIILGRLFMNYKCQRWGSPTTLEKDLADRVIRGEYYYPATNALWFYAPGSGNNCKTTWWDGNLAGKYKNHCFYKPEEGICKQLH